MRQWLKRILCSLILVIGIFGVCNIQLYAATNTAVEMKNTYRGIGLSPDGEAWTTVGSGSAERLEEGTQIRFLSDREIAERKKTVEEGQHLYGVPVNGSVEIGYWEVKHFVSQCIHGGPYEGTTFHGVTGGPICMQYYDNGWFAYCADCGNPVFHGLIYANSSVVRNIKTMAGKSGYYYLCPHSGALEQGLDYTHYCDEVSTNRYTVKYIKNNPANIYVKGVMSPTRSTRRKIKDIYD